MRPEANWQDQYRTDVGPKIAALAIAGQVAAARESDSYITAVLDELGIDADSPTSLHIPNFAGFAGDGRPVESLFEGALVRAGQSMLNQQRNILEQATRFVDAPTLSPADALKDAEAWIEMVAETLIADAARAAESVAIAQRPWVEGYVRMLNPPSCSRCAVLAGRFYLWNAGFDRHPRCDCRHIPASEADYQDLTTNPNLYFDSLPSAAQLDEQYPDLTVKMRNELGIYSQEDIFTAAGAKAIRDGADLGQVVNARRGMNTAAQNQRGWIPKGRMVRTNIFGRGVFITTEGVTKRGAARKAMGPGRPFRIMPESIYEIAKDREDAIRLLKLFGFIL